MGGQLAIKSEVGRGSLVTFTIQVSLAKESQAADKESEKPDEQHQNSGTSNNQADALTPSDFMALPTAILDRLLQAAINTDMEVIESIIEEVRQIDAVVAEELTALAAEFKYGKILELLEKNGVCN
jgi:hypothetical protein